MCISGTLLVHFQDRSNATTKQSNDFCFSSGVENNTLLTSSLREGSVVFNPFFAVQSKITKIAPF